MSKQFCVNDSIICVHDFVPGGPDRQTSVPIINNVYHIRKIFKGDYELSGTFLLLDEIKNEPHHGGSSREVGFGVQFFNKIYESKETASSMNIFYDILNRCSKEKESPADYYREY